MGREQLIHKTAWTAAFIILDSIRHLLREEEYRDAHQHFYEICRGAIEARDVLERRETLRLLS